MTQRDETESSVFDVLPPGFPPRGPASKNAFVRGSRRGRRRRLGPVGRLDKATTGLLLFTDDGGLAKRLVAAGTCRKTYVLDVAGDVTDAALASLARPLDDVTLHPRAAVRTAPADVAVLRRAATAVLEAASVLPSTGRASMA